MYTLHPDFINRAKEELNETEENVKTCTGELRNMIIGEENLFVPTDDAFLTKFLRARKYDTQKAFHMVQRYYVMRLRCPELFRIPLPSENARVFELQAQWMLPERDQFGQRVYIIRVDKFDAAQADIEDVFRTNMLALEQVVREPETQVAGISVMVDMTGLSLQHAKFFTPYYAKRTVEVVQETFPLRFKGFHVVNEPFYFDAIMAVLKPFLKEKIRKRIYLHGNDLSSLHAFISPDILPEEYGGTRGVFDNTEWRNAMLADEDYFVEQTKYGYKLDEAKIPSDI